MPLKIKEIKNLTSKKVLEVDLKKFNHQTEYSDTIIAEVVSTDNWKVGDNIQVLWSEGEKVVIRAVGGTFTNVAGKITIENLIDVSKYSFGINGQLSIGPKTNPDAVSLSVRVGNLPSKQNPKADWIIDFSDTEDGATESSIKLNQLVDWIKDKSEDTTTEVEFPQAGEAGAEQPKDFEIIFKKFYYNITQNTFDFNVQSKAGNEMKFGNFTIKKVGFRVTNAPLSFKKEKTDVIEEAGVKSLQPKATKEIAS